MAGTTENYGFDRGYKADGILPQYAVVLFSAVYSHVKAPAAALDSFICGVIQNASTASGDTVQVRKEGLSKCIAFEAIPKGIEVAIANTDGHVKDPGVWTSGDGVVGVAEEAAAASGDIFECWLGIRTLLS